jgi:hypothetical protein
MPLMCSNAPLPFLKLDVEVADKVLDVREMALP